MNPSCGDEITLKLKVDGDTIVDGAFVGDGCAISQASADIMLAMIIGKKKEEALHLGELFFKMIRGEASDEEIEELGGGFGAAGYRPYAGTDEVRGAGMADVEGNFEVRGCAARDCSVLFSVFLWKIRKNSHFAPCFRQIIRAECATMASSKDHGSGAVTAWRTVGKPT